MRILIIQLAIQFKKLRLENIIVTLVEVSMKLLNLFDKYKDLTSFFCYLGVDSSCFRLLTIA